MDQRATPGVRSFCEVHFATIEKLHTTEVSLAKNTAVMEVLTRDLNTLCENNTRSWREVIGLIDKINGDLTGTTIAINATLADLKGIDGNLETMVKETKVEVNNQRDAIKTIVTVGIGGIAVTLLAAAIKLIFGL